MAHNNGPKQRSMSHITYLSIHTWSLASNLPSSLAAVQRTGSNTWCNTRIAGNTQHTVTKCTLLTQALWGGPECVTTTEYDTLCRPAATQLRLVPGTPRPCSS